MNADVWNRTVAYVVEMPWHWWHVFVGSAYVSNNGCGCFDVCPTVCGLCVLPLMLVDVLFPDWSLPFLMETINSDAKWVNISKNPRTHSALHPPHKAAFINISMLIINIRSEDMVFQGLSDYWLDLQFPAVCSRNAPNITWLYLLSTNQQVKPVTSFYLSQKLVETKELKQTER